MAELKKFGILSVAKMNAVLSAFAGFLLGIFYAVLIPFSAIGSMPLISGVPTFLLGFGLVIILPIIYGIFGFISGAIMAALYNFFVPLVGGIEMKFKLHEK